MFNNNPVTSTGAVAVDGASNVYVTDTLNNRALEYDSPFTKDTIADRVYGQPDFTTSSAGAVSGTSLNSPTGVALDSVGNLYVADSGNNRVLEYNSPLTNDSANLVFGVVRSPEGERDQAG